MRRLRVTRYLLNCGLYVDVVDVVDSTLLHLTITHCWIPRTALCSAGTSHLEVEQIEIYQFNTLSRWSSIGRKYILLPAMLAQNC